MRKPTDKHQPISTKPTRSSLKALSNCATFFPWVLAAAKGADVKTINTSRREEMQKRRKPERPEGLPTHFFWKTVSAMARQRARKKERSAKRRA
jgi:hypothetical protein